MVISISDVIALIRLGPEQNHVSYGFHAIFNVMRSRRFNREQTASSLPFAKLSYFVCWHWFGLPVSGR